MCAIRFQLPIAPDSERVPFMAQDSDVLPASELDRVFVVLVATRNPLNIGAAARAMSNFGFRYLRVVNPYEPSFHEARSAVGAADVLAAAEQYSSVADAICDCTLVIGTTAAKHREVQLPLRLPVEGIEIIRAHLCDDASKG